MRKFFNIFKSKVENYKIGLRKGYRVSSKRYKKEIKSLKIELRAEYDSDIKQLRRRVEKKEKSLAKAESSYHKAKQEWIERAEYVQDFIVAHGNIESSRRSVAKDLIRSAAVLQKREKTIEKNKEKISKHISQSFISMGRESLTVQ